MSKKTKQNKPKLTLKQQRFVEAYLGECKGNATNAAVLAGYTGKTRNVIEVTAHDLLRNPKIIAEIERIREFDKEESVLTRKGRQIWLRKFIRRENVNDRDRLKAIEMLSKMDGDFLERRAVEAKVQVEDVRSEVRERLLMPELWADIESLGKKLKRSAEIEVES